MENGFADTLMFAAKCIARWVGAAKVGHPINTVLAPWLGFLGISQEAHTKENILESSNLPVWWSLYDDADLDEAPEDSHIHDIERTESELVHTLMQPHFFSLKNNLLG